jgi:hypothetical protein
MPTEETQTEVSDQATEQAPEVTPAAQNDNAPEADADPNEIVDPYAEDEDAPEAKTNNATDEPDDAGGEAEGQEEDTEEAAAEKPAIPEELLYRAEQAGFTKEEALEFPSAKLLEKALQRATPVTPPAQKREEAASAAGDDELKLLDMKVEDGWDEDVVKQFHSIRDYAVKQATELKALKAQFGEVHEYVSEQNRKAVEQRLTGHFEKASEQYGDIFGKGTMDQVQGIHRVNRIKAVSEMHALAEGYRSTGQKVPEEKVLMERALRNIFGEDAKKKITQEIAGKVVKRNKQLIARPSHKKGNHNLPPEVAAAKDLETKYPSIFKNDNPDAF